MNQLTKRESNRQSGIELLKIIAICIIVIHHAVQTLRSENTSIPYQDYVLDLSTATTNVQHLLLVLFSHFGSLGNAIFFVCSAWFLLQSPAWSKKKWFRMLVEIWAISVLILAVTLLLRGGDLSVTLIIKNLLPSTFLNNWYTTCYLLFYPIHPLLNTLIRKMDRKTLFRSSGAMFVLYYVLGFVKTDLFFCTNLILWVATYFMLGYVRLYMEAFCNSIKKNVCLLAVGIAGWIGMALVTNLLGLHISFFADKLLHWANNHNPFLLAIAVSLLNLLRQAKFRSPAVNAVSGLSLLMYLIHENILLRTYYRPAMFQYVYENFGYDHLVFWVFVISVLIFLFSLVCSFCYDKLLRRPVNALSDRLYGFVKKLYLKLEEKLLRMH